MPLSAEDRAKFMEALEHGVSIRTALRAIGVGKTAYYEYRKADPTIEVDAKKAAAKGVLHAAKEFRETKDPVRSRAALNFLQAHDGPRWRLRTRVHVSGGLNLKGGGLADVLAAARKAAAADAPKG